MYTVFIYLYIFYMIPNYLYSWFIVFVQALHFYCNGVSSSSFVIIISFVTALSKIS